MGVEAAKGVNVIELVLLPVQTMYRGASGLRLSCAEADPEISDPALGTIQAVGYRAEGNYIASRIIPYGDDRPPGTVALENDSRSAP
jgi:hypothetical protein